MHSLHEPLLHELPQPVQLVALALSALLSLELQSEEVSQLLPDHRHVAARAHASGFLVGVLGLRVAGPLHVTQELIPVGVERVVVFARGGGHLQIRLEQAEVVLAQRSPVLEQLSQNRPSQRLELVRELLRSFVHFEQVGSLLGQAEAVLVVECQPVRESFGEAHAHEVAVFFLQEPGVRGQAIELFESERLEEGPIGFIVIILVLVALLVEHVGQGRQEGLVVAQQRHVVASSHHELVHGVLVQLPEVDQRQ